MKSALIFLLAAAPLFSQDADTMLLKDDVRKYTILSQVDAAEAASFLTAVRADKPAERNQLASDFVNKYPQSWLLSQAYDLSARSAIDLGNYDKALTDGRLSLRLLRENPSLLILIANVEAQNKDYRRATDDASDALAYLDQIQRPANLSQDEWNSVRPQLKASAYFARARAAASGAQLQTALADLNAAAAWNPGDAEVFYLRAIVEARLDQKAAAASDLAFVYRNGSALREKATKILAVLAGHGKVDDFIQDLPPPAVDADLKRENQRPTDPQALAFGYAGPEACKGCHAEQYTSWRKTGMARMLQPYKAENVRGDFSASAQFADQPELIRPGSDGHPYFDIFTGGARNRYYVDFTIGSKWQQGYATKLDDGRLQVLPIEYNVLEKRWINYWKILDPAGSPRADIREFPKLTAATNYQQNCAICHTSQLKADVSRPNSMEHAAYLQSGIDCEMCHGPAAFHVKNPAQLPLDFRKVNNREGVRVCAQCHRQSSVREFGEGGEMNYSVKVNFVPVTWFMPYDAFSRKAFYKDGHFKETTFIVEAFTRSACYLRGTAQCATCHSPHLANFDQNQTSLKFKSNANEMCLQCHAEYRTRIAQHTRHSADSEAAQCLTCHMPRTGNALLFKARSHQIEIPTADLTERFGQEESPNVCLTCHSQKDVLWAKDQLAAWPR